MKRTQLRGLGSELYQMLNFEEQSGLFSEAVLMHFNITNCQRCTEIQSHLKIVALIQKQSLRRMRAVLESAAEASSRKAKD